MNDLILFLFLIFTATQIADIYFTIRILRDPRYYEGYRLTKWVLDRLGITSGIILIRGLSILIIGLLCLLFTGPVFSYLMLATLILLIIHFAILGWKNYKLLKED